MKFSFVILILVLFFNFVRSDWWLFSQFENTFNRLHVAQQAENLFNEPKKQ